uniref:Sulfide:quinone oxidoreductase, mitochondrial n=1 Tax=Strombidium rassoulzadegani TaxID=1082188 RepID=A0A7S3CR54_9SPIT|mmetsp:Transcript_4648/g.7881  ORF Transcript_4648/g.7881 Transcript_4648/m.7881 type:complete len:321 (+) Transcript_4648:384-1346(+)
MTKSGMPITYDYLVVASGLELRYDQIPGSLEALDDQLCPAGSMYRLDYAKKMSRIRQNFKGGKAIFTLPVMPVKCGGAPQKVMYLSEESFRKNGVRDKCDIHFYTSVASMFPNCEKYAKALKPIAEAKGIDVHFKHLIQSVDGNNRTAKFKNLDTEEMVDVDFDLLHVVPPQTSHQFVRESPLAAENGFLDVEQFTLRHNKFNNIWGLGDVCNLPTAKTAAAIFSQSPVVAHQIQNSVKNLPSNAKYDGYSSCPLYTGDKQLMLMEFKYGGIPNETFRSNQEVPHRFFYHVKKDIFPSVYWQFVPTGKWFGKRTIFAPKF